MSSELAVFTMSYNEDVMLPLWGRYYSGQVGRENVFILDHGSERLPDLGEIEVIGLKRGALDEVDRVETVARFQKSLLERYSHVLFTDCDEFIVAHPARYTSLLDYCRGLSATPVRCVGVDVIQEAPNLPTVRWDEPILAQRPWGAIRHWSCKTLLSNAPLTWEPGFHTCKEASSLDLDLWMFHLKHADQANLLRRLALTRSLQWSERSIRSGLGGSHRLPDAALLAFLSKFQKRREDSSLDDLDIREIVESGGESRLRRIPAEFIPVL